MNQILVKARYKTSDQITLDNLGIKTEEKNYTLKSCFVNKDNINWIEEYEGYCLLNFIGGSQLITNIPMMDAWKFSKDNND